MDYRLETLMTNDDEDENCNDEKGKFDAQSTTTKRFLFISAVSHTLLLRRFGGGGGGRLLSLLSWWCKEAELLRCSL